MVLVRQFVEQLVGDCSSDECQGNEGIGRRLDGEGKGEDRDRERKRERERDETGSEEISKEAESKGVGGDNCLPGLLTTHALLGGLDQRCRRPKWT